MNVNSLITQWETLSIEIVGLRAEYTEMLAEFILKTNSLINRPQALSDKANELELACIRLKAIDMRLACCMSGKIPVDELPDLSETPGKNQPLN